MSTTTRATSPARPTLRLRARDRVGWWSVLGLVVLIASAVVGLTIGPASNTAVVGDLAPITPSDVLASAWRHIHSWLASWTPLSEPGPGPLSTIRDAIIWQGRAPRLLTAAAVGAGLALAGAVMQALTRNPLADPYLLGVSSGASVGAVAVLLLGISFALPVAAFVGGMLALGLTMAIGSTGGHVQPARMVLAGVAVAQACSALVSFIVFTSSGGDSYRQVLSWLMGSVAGATWNSAAIAGIALGVVGAGLLTQTRTLDALTFGDTAATALGIHVNRTRWALLGATALLTGAMVSVSGAIGFVGLMVPHMVRLLTGPSHARLLPLSAIAGAIFLLWSDTAARTIFAPMELPVGILTAAFGAPVFVWLLMRGRR